MAHIDWQKFDHQLMDSTSVPSIKHDLKPAGFSYAVYGTGGTHADFKVENAWGIRDLDHDPLTNTSVRECDSMSKTLTALIMMYQISLVPDVRDAYHAYETASAATKDAKKQAWRNRVEHYLNRPIKHYVPESSGDGTNWEPLAATATIRIKDLMLHTSGLSVKKVDGAPKVVTGGDDWVAIQKDLMSWSSGRYHDAQTNVPVLYSNSNFALLRYVIVLFNLITVCEQSSATAHGLFHGTWDERDHLYGGLYRDIGRGSIFKDLAEPLPDILPYGKGVSYFNADHSTAWDINTSQDWPLVAGAWGWKLTARKYAHTLANIITGTTMPAEYWSLMLEYTEASPSGYGMAIYKASSPGIGAYYSHNGGDGNDQGRAGGAWFAWDDKVLVFLCNSPLAAPYGTEALDTDQSGYYIYKAIDDAVAAATT